MHPAKAWMRASPRSITTPAASPWSWRWPGSRAISRSTWWPRPTRVRPPLATRSACACSGTASTRPGQGWIRARAVGPTRAPSLRPAVHVLVADDVVLAQVTARLHLDQLQHLRARVLEPVLRAQRDVGRLVGMQLEHVVVAGHACGAADYDPVLGAALVRLQRQARARLDLDPLDLE